MFLIAASVAHFAALAGFANEAVLVSSFYAAGPVPPPDWDVNIACNASVIYEGSPQMLVHPRPSGKYVREEFVGCTSHGRRARGAPS